MSVDVTFFTMPVSRRLIDVLHGVTRWGYRWTAPVEQRDTYIYFDTQDGRLYSKGYRLRGSRDTGHWQLLEGENLSRETMGTSPPDMVPTPVEWTAIPRLGDMTRGEELLPQLEAGVRVSKTRLQREGEEAIELSVESWAFRDPYGQGPPEKAVLLRVQSPNDNRESAFLATFIRDLLKFTPHPTDILTTGLERVGRPLPGAPVPDRFRLLPEDTIGQAGLKILGRQAYLMWGNTDGTRRDLHPEYLHDLRVATRRARAALRLLAPELGREWSERIRTELGWVADCLGEVRDLDVFLARLSSQFDRARVPAEQREEIVNMLSSRRSAAQAAVVSCLDSERYQRAREALAQGPEPGELEPESDPQIPAREWGMAQIAGALERVCRWMDRPARAFSTEQLHRLRIRFKRLRYTAEFFRDYFDRGISEALQACIRFQDTLGDHQDACVALENLDELVLTRQAGGNVSPPFVLAIGSLQQIQREIAAGKRRKFERLWGEFPRRARTFQQLLN